MNVIRNRNKRETSRIRRRVLVTRWNRAALPQVNNASRPRENEVNSFYVTPACWPYGHPAVRCRTGRTRILNVSVRILNRNHLPNWRFSRISSATWVEEPLLNPHLLSINNHLISRDSKPLYWNSVMNPKNTDVSVHVHVSSTINYLTPYSKVLEKLIVT
jgi:hypothetical protein